MAKVIQPILSKSSKPTPKDGDGKDTSIDHGEGCTDEIDKTPGPKNPEEEGINKEQILCLPYIWGVSEKIMKNCSAITKLKVTFKPVQTMRQSLMRVKNRIPTEKKGVVYPIPYLNCS